MFIKKGGGWSTFGWDSPFDEMDRMRKQLALLADRVSSGYLSEHFAGVFPLCNVTEDTNNYYIRAELPGLTSEDLQISVTGDGFSISGERKIKRDKADVKYHRKERESGKFNRIINLPGQIDIEKVEAHNANGVLTVTLPKSESTKPRQIVIKTS
ncbi:MAG: heat-shock protein Hsp20 [Desulfobacca sp.]|nr:heat-shock protein Hsp20 [Desulfobacca sp.]